MAETTHAARTAPSLDLTAAFKALSDPTRRRLLEFLCARCCPAAIDDAGDVRPADGPTVGEVCCQVAGLDYIPSRISFHLKELRLAGLVTMEKRGRNTVCGVNQDAVRALAMYLNEQAEGAQPRLLWVRKGGCA